MSRVILGQAQVLIRGRACPTLISVLSKKNLAFHAKVEPECLAPKFFLTCLRPHSQLADKLVGIIVKYMLLRGAVLVFF